MDKERKNLMQIEYKAEVARPDDYASAEAVSDWINSAIANGTNMLPKSREDILILFANGQSVLVLNDAMEPIGHAAITEVYSNCVEIGAMVTSSDWQRKGIGTRALRAVLQTARMKYPEKTIFALANNQSGPLFTKLGAQIIDESELDAEVWTLCAKCPALPVCSDGDSFKCCDTAFDLTKILL